MSGVPWNYRIVMQVDRPGDAREVSLAGVIRAPAGKPMTAVRRAMHDVANRIGKRRT